MPGPFPGMDPYLEKPTRWLGAHRKLIVAIEAALNAILPAPYVANVEGRCYIERPGNEIRPDIFVSELPYPVPTTTSGTAVAERSDPALIFRAYAEEETVETFVDIWNVEDNQRVVATIELLSHTNKTTQNRGRELYLAKQRTVLASPTHLIEIDLLRSGKHTVAVPQDVFRPEHRYDYLICLHRAGTGLTYTVWLNTLRQRLPRIAVPLEEGVADVLLDLQAVFDRNYDEGAYLRKIDYRQDPVPPLNADDAEWANILLQSGGLRNA